MSSRSGAAWGQVTDWSTGLRVPASGRRRTEWTPPPATGVLPKRPFTFAETLDSGFRLLKRCPGPTFGIGAIVAGLVALMLAVAAIFGVRAMGTRIIEDLFIDSAAGSGLSFAAQFGASLAEYLTLSTLVFFSGLASTAARAGFRGESLTLSQAWRQLRGVRLRLIGLSLLLGAAHLVSFGLFLAPGMLAGVRLGLGWGLGLGAIGFIVWWLATLFFGVRLAFAGPALVQERLGAFAALKRSWQLTGRGFFRLAGVTVLCFWLASQIAGIIVGPIIIFFAIGTIVVLFVFRVPSETEVMVFMFISGAFASVIALVAVALLNAYRSGFLASLYFNERMRSEGYDLVLLAEAEAA